MNNFMSNETDVDYELSPDFWGSDSEIDGNSNSYIQNLINNTGGIVYTPDGSVFAPSTNDIPGWYHVIPTNIFE